MKLNKNLFAILAVFLLVISAGAVSAADDGNTDMNTTDIADDNAIENATFPVGIFDGVTVLDDPHENPNAYAVEEFTYFIKDFDKSIGIPTGDATDNVINSNGNVTAHAHTLQKSSTGNPILALLVVTTVLTGYAIIRRD